MPPTFEAIGIVADDMSAALAFYRRLGLEVVLEPDAQAAHAELGLPGGLRLMLDSVATMQMFDEGYQKPPPGTPRSVSLAFHCEDPAGVDATYADLVGAGYEGHLEPWDAFWGQRYATVLDPDGNAVDLFAPLG